MRALYVVLALNCAAVAYLVGYLAYSESIYRLRRFARVRRERGRQGYVDARGLR